MRTCPYPHPNGAESNPAELTAAPESLAGTCATPQCLQTSFFCPACGASNRTLARFCRSCCQTLSFENALAQTHAGVEILQPTLTKGARQVALSRLQGRTFTAFENAWGYLVFAAEGWGLGVLANTSMNPPRLLYHFAIADGEEIHTLHKISAEASNPSVLGVSRTRIFALTFLPHFDCKEIFQISEPGWQIESTLCMGEQLVVRLYHFKSKVYRWLLLEAGATRELNLPGRGPFSAMIAAPGGKFFCATEAELVQYHVHEHREQRIAAPAFGINIKIRPQLHPRTGEIFWLGLDRLIYRCNANATTIKLKAFGRQRLEALHFFCSAYDDYLYVLTPNNLLVLDFPSGEDVWNFTQHLPAKISCSNAAPRAWGNYLVFAFRSPGLAGTEERVGLFSLAKREAPLLLHPAVATAPMPIAGVAHVIAARKPQAAHEREKSALLLFQV